MIEIAILESQIKVFRDYSSTVETSFQNYVNDFEKEADPDNKENQDFYEHNSDKWFPYKHSFPQLHRQSLIISIYSYLERRLLALCKSIEDPKFFPNKNRGIDKYKDYLEKKEGLSFPLEEWNKIKSYKIIRDTFVHETEYIVEDEKINILKSSTGKINHVNFENNKIHLEPEACNEFIELAETFLKEIFSQTKQQPSN